MVVFSALPLVNSNYICILTEQRVVSFSSFLPALKEMV